MGGNYLSMPHSQINYVSKREAPGCLYKTDNAKHLLQLSSIARGTDKHNTVYLSKLEAKTPPWVQQGVLCLIILFVN